MYKKAGTHSFKKVKNFLILKLENFLIWGYAMILIWGYAKSNKLGCYGAMDAIGMYINYYIHL